MEIEVKVPGSVNMDRLEAKYKRMIEKAYNLRQSDDSLSDIFYYDAHKLLAKIDLLKASITSN